MTNKTKMRTLHIRLLRKGRTPEDAFTETFRPDSERALQEWPWNAVEGARLFIGQIYSNTPSWRDVLQQVSPDLPEEVFTSGAGAVVFIPVEDRFAAICFGHVHIALNDPAFERQFGLRVTLNSVPRDNLRSIDLATPDAVTFQKRVQASKDSDVQAFGVDMHRDLARVAGGTPRKPTFASFVAGKDRLSITCRIEPQKFHEKCAEIVSEYGKTTYQKEFAWVDNMRRVEEKDTIEKLDESLGKAIKDLKAGIASDLHMTPPEVANYTEGSLLRYNGFGSRGTNFHSLSINDYISELKRCSFEGGIGKIKEKHKVKAKANDEGEFSKKWRIYDSFVFETTLRTGGSQEHYVLFAGDWYKVEKSFKNRIEANFNEIERVTIVGKTTCRNEKELIDHLEASRADLIKLDSTKINPQDVRYANIEPCDFFSVEKDFIHQKDGNSSGSISHLWSQGVVSAGAFISDKEFRMKLRAKVKSFKAGFEVYLPKSTDKVVREDYRVVYGIMRPRYTDGTLGLPFFSKVSLRAAVERLEQFGIPVAIELIEKLASNSDDGDEENDDVIEEVA